MNCRLKLLSAKSDIDSLTDEISRFITDETIHRVTTTRDPTTDRETRMVSATQMPDKKWGIKIGTVAHCLRSALDNLIWDLASRNGNTPFRQTCFPIHLAADEFQDKALKGRGARLQSLSVEDQEKVRHEQPYFANNGYKNDPLWLLHELNNIDKHRVIPVTHTEIRHIAIKPVVTKSFIGVGLNLQRTPIVEGQTIQLTEPDAQFLKASGNIYFDDELGLGIQYSVCEALQKMYDRVAGILDRLQTLN